MKVDELLPTHRAPLKLIHTQLIPPNRNIPPLPRPPHNLLKRCITTPVLYPISGRPVPDHHDRFSIILTHDITQKITHTLCSHQHTLTVRKWLCNPPCPLLFYLHKWL